VKITSDESASSQLQLSWLKYRSWAFVAAVTLVHLMIGARSVGPMYVYNEVGYMASANVLSGHDMAWSLCGASQGVAYPLVLAPLWWLPIGPLSVYQLAVYVSAALGALAIWPATALARRFGAKGGVALGVGALVTLVPARALMDNYVLSENPLTLLVLCVAVLAFRVAKSAGRFDTALLGLAAGAAVSVDSRALPLAVVTVAWVFARGILKRTTWPDAAAGIVAALALSLGGLLAQGAMGARLFALGAPMGDLVGHLNAVRLVEVVLGQAFVQVVSWTIFTALGLFAALNKSRHAARKAGVAGVAAAWWWLTAMIVAQGVYFVWTLAGSAEYGSRFDVPILGRYLDPFVVPLAVLGAVTLWRRVSTRLSVAALAACFAVVIAFSAVAVPRVGADSGWERLSVPGLLPFMDLNAGFQPVAILVAGGAALVACLLLWVFRRHDWSSLVLAVCVAAAASCAADFLRVDPFEEATRAQTIISPMISANPQYEATIAADLLPCYERDKLQLELAGIATVIPEGGEYGDGLVVGPADWPYAKTAGLREVTFSQWEGARLWAGTAVK
jgi:hypothetical protein